MRKLFTILSTGAVCAFTLAFAPLRAGAQVPVWQYQNALTGAPIVASSATNYNLVIDCRKQAKIGLAFSSTNTAAGATIAGSYVVPYQRSWDGINYETTLSSASSPALNGTTNVFWGTNIDTLGCGYIRIPFITNSMGSGTNIAVTVGYDVKISAP